MCLFQLNCKKEDYYTPKPNATEKFFTVPSGTNAQVLRVMDEIKKRNNRKEFVTQFAASNGYPVWNKVLMGTSQKQYANASLSGNNLDGVTDTTILIPFVMEGEFSVKGFIRATLNDSVSLSYSLAKDYKVYEEKLDNSKTASSAFAMLSMVLNKMVFNEDYYKITNPKLFSTDTLHDKTSKIKITAFNFSITDSAGFKQTTICVEHSTILTHCGTPDNAACIPVCDAPFCPSGQCWQVEISQTACYTAGLPDIGGTGGGGDNGGGGEIPYVYPCQGTQNNPSPFTATNNVVDTSDCPVPGEGDGWIPWQDEPGEYNPYIADDVIIDSSISNNYPCVTRIIDSLTNYANINALTQVALQTIFGVNKMMHLTFTIEPNWGIDSIDAGFKAYTPHETGQYDFHATIKLNPWMLQNSTEQYIAATIIHEAVHAYIGFKARQLYLGDIDSTTFKELFPLYWAPPITSYLAYIDPTKQAEHNAMAGNLLNLMTNPLISLYPNLSINSTIRDSVYKSLSWGGLFNTTVWHNKVDTCNIKAINAVSRNTTLSTAFILTNSPSCTDTFNFNYLTFNLKKGCN